MKSAAWGLVPVLVMAAVATAGAQDEAWHQFKGQVVVSDVLLAPSFDSDQTMIAALNRVKCTQIAETHGFWRLHMVAFLDRAVDGETARVVARDVTVAGAAHAIRPKGSAAGKAVRVFEVEAQPEQKILQMNDFVLSESMGFQQGHDYELTVEDGGDAAGVAARRVVEKRDVYARGVVTLR